MWSGIINLATKWNNSADSYLNQDGSQFSRLISGLNNKIDNLIKTRIVLSFKYISMDQDFNWESLKLDICQYANDTFITPQEDQVKDFSLNLAYQMEKVLNKSSNDKLLSMIAQHRNFDALKNEICQKEFF